MTLHWFVILQYREFIQKVMISEALIRIYSLVNGVAFNQAEKEMRFGAEYDGPVPVSNLLDQLEII